MVTHRDQDRVHLNGQNGHTQNGHKNFEDLHGQRVGMGLADKRAVASTTPTEVQVQLHKIDTEKQLQLRRVDTEEQTRSRKVDYVRLLELGRELLLAIGEDVEREGLLDTPRRWADWWREFIEYNPGTTETTFQSMASDQMVCVSGMRVFSLC